MLTVNDDQLQSAYHLLLVIYDSIFYIVHLKYDEEVRKTLGLGETERSIGPQGTSDHEDLVRLICQKSP